MSDDIVLHETEEPAHPGGEAEIRRSPRIDPPASRRLGLVRVVFLHPVGRRVDVEASSLLGDRSSGGEMWVPLELLDLHMPNAADVMRLVAHELAKGVEPL